MDSLPRTPSGPKPNPQPRPPRPAALLAVWIADAQGELHAYEVELLAPEPGTGITKAYRLRNADNGQVYDVALTVPHGAECECGDFTFRGAQKGSCKHLDALRQFGMLPLGPKPQHRSVGDFARNDPQGYEEMLAGAPDQPPLTEAEMNQLADLVEIDMSPDAPPF